MRGHGARRSPSSRDVNALFDDEAGIVHRHGGVHIGIAAQTPSGLMVPVVRHAEARDLWDCAAEVNRLAEAAQDRHGDAARSCRARPSPSPRSAPWAAWRPRRSSTIRRWRSSASTRCMVRPVWDGSQFMPRKMMNLSSSLRPPGRSTAGTPRSVHPAHQDALLGRRRRFSWRGEVRVVSNVASEHPSVLGRLALGGGDWQRRQCGSPSTLTVGEHPAARRNLPLEGEMSGRRGGGDGAQGRTIPAGAPPDERNLLQAPRHRRRSRRLCLRYPRRAARH